jgi:hypothetical protein
LGFIRLRLNTLFASGGLRGASFSIVSQALKSFKGLYPAKQHTDLHQPPEIPVNYSIYKNFS